MKQISGWLIYNGYNNSNSYIEMISLYKQSSIKKGINLELIKHNDVYCLIQNNCTHLKAKLSIKPDFVLFLNKDITLARHLKKLGYNLFNSIRNMEYCDDKSLTYQALADNNIPIPKTIFSPVATTSTQDVDINFLDFIEKELGFPIIMKKIYGSFGKQVYLANDREELLTKRKNIIHSFHLYQECITTSIGRDVRIYVVGNKVVASILRTNGTDFRATTHGAKMELYTPNKEFENLAIKVAKLLQADFCGIDILFGENDKPIISEANSSAYIKSIYDYTRINIADYILDYIIKKLS